jgi:outer membrane protein TolC
VGNLAVKTRTVRALFALLCPMLALAGCHGRDTAPASAPPPPAQLPVTTRTPIQPDVSAVPTVADKVTPTPTEYRKLTATDCRKLAIAHAPYADDLDRHPENDAPAHPHVHKKKAEEAETNRLVRGHSADESRNRAAGEALDEFYKLIEAEGQLALLKEADAEVRAQLANALKAEKSGLKDRADITAIRRHLLDIEAQRAKLEAGIGALNASLSARLGLAVNDPLPLWPSDPLKVKAEDVDADQAVATGLHYRPDLNLLRVLAEGNAAELADGLLRSMNPLLAAKTSSNPLASLLAPIFAPFTGQPERRHAETTARVKRTLADRERQAEAEIRAAIAMLRGARAAVAARALDVKQVEAKVEDLLTRQKAGLNVTAELVTARLDLLKARGALLTGVTDWHAAEVKLRQAMGLLVRE